MITLQKEEIARSLKTADKKRPPGSAETTDTGMRRFLRAYGLSLFTKNENNLFLETEKPICNINDSNTFILIFVVSSTGNYHFGISIPDL